MDKLDETLHQGMIDSDRQRGIDYGFWFAKHYFHGQMVALLSGKIDPELLKKVEEAFK